MAATEYPIGFKSAAFYVVAVVQASIAAVAAFGFGRGGATYLLGVLVIAAILAVLFAGIGYAINHLRVAVGDQVSIGSPLRSTRYLRSAIEKVELVDLAQQSGLAPRTRTNGVQLGNLRYGWYRLENGRKAFVALTRTSDIVHLTTRDGVDLLVSPEDAPALANFLR